MLSVKAIAEVKEVAMTEPALHEQVLGAQTFEASVVFSNPQVTVWSQPFQYDAGSGKWNYKITWQREGLRQGSISIDGNLFVEKANGTGEAFTGFTMLPNETHFIMYYSQYRGEGVRVANHQPFTVISADENEDLAVALR